MYVTDVVEEQIHKEKKLRKECKTIKRGDGVVRTQMNENRINRPACRLMRKKDCVCVGRPTGSFG